ncbi:MAG TPA: polysaccharide deacetylase family protein, partial [Gemmatimonadales bacterium]|nr:polysaccharide deacetylase family protein [Gemmatimonadales bacterium]
MRAIVLEYHDVVDGDFGASGFAGVAADSYKLSAADFAAHLDALGGLPAPVGGDVRALGDAPSPPPVLFTFDDGGVGACDAADLLERRGWLGHFFVTTERIGTPGFLDAAQLRDLEKRGHVIGSHSHSHPPRMARLTPEEARSEWHRSRSILGDLLGHP